MDSTKSILQFELPEFSSENLFDTANFFSKWNGTCLLYSGGPHDSAQKSFLALFPYEIIEIFGTEVFYKKGKESSHFFCKNPWDALQASFFEKNKGALPAFGWFNYEMGAFSDPDYVLPYTLSSTPDAFWERCALVLTFDHATGLATVKIDLSAKEHLDFPAKEWVERFEDIKALSSFLKENSLKLQTVKGSKLCSLDNKERRKNYMDQILQIKELILQGEVYQVNLSQIFEFESSRDPFELFFQLVSLNPSPFSAYFQHDKMTLVSTSPERFLCKRELELETRPIKGTIQRGKSLQEDRNLKNKLLNSPKEKAELLMITDLMRNDLGKISEVGSVQTESIWHCEEYQNVFHLLSIIRSKVKKELRPLEIIRTCFPGGSITGCPKLRAIEVIHDLEKRPRGIYTGSIGYITDEGDFDLNIAIRTLKIQKNVFTLQLGGGIVIDSNPEEEYQETLFKGESFFKLL